MTSQSFKILFCETEKGAPEKLKELLNGLRHDFEMSETEAEKIKRSISIFEPSVLLTDHCFWLRDDAIEIIQALRITETLPIVVWAKKMNAKILSAIFNFSNIHFVKQSDNGALLSETLCRSFISSK